VDDAFSTCIGGVGGMNYTPSQQTVTRAVLDCATTNCLAMCQ